MYTLLTGQITNTAQIEPAILKKIDAGEETQTNQAERKTSKGKTQRERFSLDKKSKYIYNCCNGGDKPWI